MPYLAWRGPAGNLAPLVGYRGGNRFTNLHTEDPVDPPGGGIELLGVGSLDNSFSEFPITPYTTSGNWYVDPQAGTNGSGTVGSPFNNLNSALSAVSDGQTILVRAGTITPTSRFFRSTNWATGIKIMGYGTERPVIDCSSLGTGSNSRVLTLAGRREHWKGFEIINHLGTGNDAQVVYVEGQYNHIEDVWAHDCNGTPFYVANWGNDAGYNIFQDCVAWRLGDGISTSTNVADGISLTGNTSSPTNGNRVIRFFVANGADDGIDMFRGRNTRVLDSVVYGSGYYWNGNTAGDGIGFKMGGGDSNNGDNYAIGCLSLNNRASGFTHNEARNDSGTNPNVVFAFCTSAGNGYGVDAGGNNTNHKNVLRDTIINNSSTRFVGPNAVEMRTTNLLGISNPQFANTGLYDWSLGAGSAGIGAGRRSDFGATTSAQASASGTVDNLGASVTALRIAKAWVSFIQNGGTPPTPTGIHYSTAPEAWSGFGVNPEAVQPPAGAVLIQTSSNPQTVINANPAGTIYAFESGVHRITSTIVPKAGDTLWGQTGAVLNGSTVLSGWSYFGGNIWTKTGNDLGWYSTAGECRVGESCKYPDNLFRDGQWLTRVASQSDVNSEGKYWINRTNDLIYYYTTSDPNSSLMEQAFAGQAIKSTNNDVTVRNLKVTQFANSSQRGVISPRNVASSVTYGYNWLIQDCEVWNCHGVGIEASTGTRVINNSVHHIGQLGLGADEQYSTIARGGIIIEGNDVYSNNLAGYSAGWEAGASKFHYTRNIQIRNNRVVDNYGFALWCDFENFGSVYENNLVEDNYHSGIFHEVSGNAVIRYNTLRRNGYRDGSTGYSWAYDCAIHISNSFECEVYENYCEDNHGGINVSSQARGSGTAGSWNSRDNNIYNNVVQLQYEPNSVKPGGGTGLYQHNGAYTDVGHDMTTNRWEDNAYYVSHISGDYFGWPNTSYTFANWQASPRLQDTTGSAIVGSPPAFEASGKLTWTPPDTSGYTTYNLPVGGGTITLNDNTDYILNFTAPITGNTLTIKGGRNLVMIGGEFRRDTVTWNPSGTLGAAESTQAGLRIYKSDSWTSANQLNNGRIVHIEGVLFRGYYLSDGVQTNAPEADVRVQNCRIEIGMWYRETSRDGYGTPHPDVIQPWGGVGWLRLDKVTGLATTQGLMLKPDFNSPNQGYMQFKRVNIRGTDAPATNLAGGGVEATDPGATYPNPQPNDNRYFWWTNGNEGGIRVERGSVWMNNLVRSFDGNWVFWPKEYSVSSDGFGTYAVPFHTEGWTGSGSGRVYQGNPPAGDYVPVGVSGMSYVSPGYLI